jgi:TetR/AcrR family transcriptional regulator
MTDYSNWTEIHTHILQLEREGLVTRTFRRLDPERQQAVLGAILDEAIAKGPTNLNIKQVAERAEVSVGSLYQYFGSRDGLLNFAIALCVRYMSDMFDSFRPYLVNVPLKNGLTDYLTGGVEWSQTQIGMIQFFMRAAYQGDPDLAERVVRPIGTLLREIVREMLGAAVARGEVREDIDLDAAARVINALMIVVGDSQLLPYLNNYFQVTDVDMPLTRILDTLMTLILHGIGTAQDDTHQKGNP